jgi:hypothetical protein
VFTSAAAPANEDLLRRTGYLYDSTMETWRHPTLLRVLDAAIARTMRRDHVAQWVADGARRLFRSPAHSRRGT